MNHSVKQDSATKMLALALEIERYRKIAVALVGVGLLVGIWGAFALEWWPRDFAGFGSFLAGTTGAFWTLAGIVLIYVAFLGQRQQILQSQDELELTREELILTRAEMAEQTATFEAQRFDTSFFSMLSAHEALVRELDASGLQHLGAGRRMFAQLFGEMIETLNAKTSFSDKDTLEAASRVYDSFYSRLDAQLGPYYRSLFQIISFVDERGPQSAGDVERRRYASICRARMSSEELLVFFYNLATERGHGFLALAKKYSLLKHLPHERLYHTDHWRSLMDSHSAA